jgi:Transposase IS200 like.
MRRQKIAVGSFYHVYNRGVDKRKIFLTLKNHERFISQLKKFKGLKPAGHVERKFDPDGKIIKIISYCLMPNHFHLLLVQLEEDGISKYLHRLETGYTMYFNKCHDRTGVLLQGTFKCKLVKTNSQLLQLSKYIHTNPIDVVRVKGDDPEMLADRLVRYRWSSLGEYLGNTSPDESVVDDFDPVLGQFKTRDDYRKYVLDRRGLASRLSLDEIDEDRLSGDKRTGKR